MILLIFMLVAAPFFSPAVWAFDGNRWSFGLITGGGLGLGNCAEPNCTLPNIDDNNYGFVTVMATGAYRFSYEHSVRVAIGLDHYTHNPPYANPYEVGLAAEGYYIYHFTNERDLFSPYLLTGFRIPTFNVGLGLGNEFGIGDRLSIIIEAMATTLFTIDSRFEGRAGVLMHF